MFTMTKTCGNCGHSKPYKMIEAPIGSHVLCPDAGEVIEADWSDVCDEWVPKTVGQAFAEGFDEGLFKLEYEQLEQRYQQLAKVAKDATLALQMIETVAHDTIAERLSHAALLDVQEALEELGVEV